MNKLPRSKLTRYPAKAGKFDSLSHSSAQQAGGYSASRNKEDKIKRLKEQLAKYEGKLAFKMKTYRGVIHESALSELKHSEVMVLRAMVADLKKEIYDLEHTK